MIITTNINTALEINKLEDLHKLKPIMEANNMKVNKSQIARELGVDPRTVAKLLDSTLYCYKLIKKKQIILLSL